MPGFSNITGLESIMFADNASFDGTERGGAMSTDGQLWIGDTTLPHVKLGNITSPNGSLTIGYTSPNITIDIAPGVRTVNLGIAYSASTFSITQANGSALSPTETGYITIPSRANPGQQKVYNVTANQSFTDSTGVSTIIGNLFGLTTGIAYANTLPFYIYAVTNDAETAVSFMISRVPHRTISPPSSNIGKTGSAVASTQGSFFAFNNPTVTDYDNNPCVCIGAFRMTMNASNDWAVTALSNGSATIGTNIQADGIGCFHEGTKFQMSGGQFGASAGTFFKPNGGTAPAWSSQSIDFTMFRSGYMFANMAGIGRTQGAGAVNTLFASPYVHVHSGDVGSCEISGAIGVARALNGTNETIFLMCTGTTAVAPLLNSNIGAGVNMYFGMRYMCDPM